MLQLFPIFLVIN